MDGTCKWFSSLAAEQQCRSKPLETTEPSPSPVPPEMSEESALKKIDEDVKEFFAVRNIHEEAYYLSSSQVP